MLQDKKEKEYQLCIRNNMEQNTMTASAVRNAVLKHYNVPIDVYEEHEQVYRSNPQTKKALATLDEQISKAKMLMSPHSYMLEKEETIKYI